MSQLLFPTTVNAVSKQLNANYTNADTVITLTNTTGVQNKPGVCLINRVDTNGTLQPTANWTYIEFTATSGATLTGCTVISGGQDQALGKVVEFVSDVTQQQRILDTLTAEHNDDGTHKETALDSMIAGTEAQGDIIYHNGTIWTRLPRGTDGNILTQASSVPSWAAPAGLATDTLWDAAGDLVQGTGANTAAKLTIGAVNTILRSTGSAAAWTAPRFKVGASTRDLAAATSTVSVTGVGWLPKFMIFYGFVNGSETLTMGMSDGTNSTYFNYYATDALTGTTGLVGKFESGANTVTIGVAFTADGVDITFTKANSPIGTLIYGYALLG